MVLSMIKLLVAALSLSVTLFTHHVCFVVLWLREALSCQCVFTPQSTKQIPGSVMCCQDLAKQLRFERKMNVIFSSREEKIWQIRERKINKKCERSDRGAQEIQIVWRGGRNLSAKACCCHPQIRAQDTYTHTRKMLSAPSSLSFRDSRHPKLKISLSHSHQSPWLRLAVHFNKPLRASECNTETV